MYNVMTYGAVGDGVTDDTTVIQDAIDDAAVVGGEVYFPNGTYLITRVTLKSKVHLRGEGREATTLKMKNSSNADIIYGYAADSLWGTDSIDGISSWGIRGLTLDGNKDNNTSGSGIAIYGSGGLIRDVYIKQCAEYGIRTEWGPNGQPLFGMETRYEDICIDGTGKHGFYFCGPHDSRVFNLTVIDASRNAHNSWSGICVSGNGNGQWVNCHVWNNHQAIRHKYALEMNGFGLNQISNSSFEGAQSANALFGSAYNMITGTNFYYPWGGSNILLKQPTYLEAVLWGQLPGFGLPDCVGVVMGETGDNVSGSVLDLQGNNQADGWIDFTYSAGHNDIKVTGWNPSGVPYIGTPHVDDVVKFNVGGTGGSIFKQTLEDWEGTWLNYSANPTGFSSVTVARQKYRKIGKTVIVDVEFSGTSNSTGCTFKLPIAPAVNNYHLASLVQDNGAYQNGVGKITLTAGSTTATAYKTLNSGTWTNSGAKSVLVYGLVYQI